MKISILNILILLLFNSCVQSQTFEVNIDTINVEIKNYLRPAIRASLTHAVKHEDKYYCFFRESGLYYFGVRQNHFFIISADGTIEQKPEIPTSIDMSMYFDLFVRNDSVILKTYYDRDTYYLDLANYEWVSLPEADDVIYEDEKFYVTLLNFGEWGSTTWFKDKNTNKEFELASAGTIVNRVENTYFITSPVQVLKIEDPLKLAVAAKENSYNIIKKRERYYGSEYSKGTEIIYRDTTYSMWDNKLPDVQIVTSFVFSNKLFHLCTDSVSTYIAKVNEGVLIPIQHLGKRYRVFNWNNSYRHKTQKDGSQLLKFDTEDLNNYGFIEIIQNKINITHLKHDVDTINHIGTDNFEPLFNFLFSELDSLPFSKVSSLEHKFGGVNLKLNRKGPLHESYYPNRRDYDFDGSVRFLRTEDNFVTKTVQYYFTKGDSLVKTVFVEWTETEHYYQEDISRFHEDKTDKIRRFDEKLTEIKTLLTNKMGVLPKIENRPNNSQKYSWESKNGLKVDFYIADFAKNGGLRMIIYYE